MPRQNGENAQGASEIKEPVGIQGHPPPPVILRGIAVCIDGLQNPSPSRSPITINVVVVGTCSVRVHPREFLFIPPYRFICRPVPSLAGDASDPFAGGLQEGRAR